jgi:tetratricopeptide (TPR) repeat protein
MELQMMIAALMSRIGVSVRPESWKAAEERLESSLSGLAPEEQCIAAAHITWLLFFADEQELSFVWLERSFDLPKQFAISAEAQCIVDTHIGEVIHRTGDLQRALSLLQPAADRAFSQSDQMSPETCCNAFRAYGALLSSLGRLDVATKWMFEASFLADTEKESISPIFRASALRLYGNAQLSCGVVDDAARLTANAVKVVMESEVDAITECNAFVSYGEVMLRLKRNVDAGIVLAKAVHIQRSTPIDAVTTCRVYRHYGQYLSATGKYAEAVPWLREALRFSLAAANSPVLSHNCAINLSEALIFSGHFAEADSVLTKALGALDYPECSPLTKLGVQSQIVKLRFEEERYLEAADMARTSQLSLLSHLLHVDDPEGVDASIKSFSSLFEIPRRVSRGELINSEVHDAERDGLLLWFLLESLDTQKCIWIREQLFRRTFVTHSEPPATPVSAAWRPGPADWLRLFPIADENNHTGPTTNRAIRGGSVECRKHRRPPLIERIYDDDRVVKNAFCRPIEGDEVHEMVSENTVILNYYFEDDDLLCLPAHWDNRTQKAAFMRSPGGDLFCVPDIRHSLEEIVRDHQMLITAVIEDISDGTLFEGRRFTEHREMQQRVYGAMYEMLQLETLLEMLELQLGRSRSMRVVIIPDECLYQLPFHAAWCADEQMYFYEQVQSVTYGLSLRTLSLQYQIDRADETPSYPLRANVFANANGDTNHPELQNVRREVGNLMLVSRGRDVESIQVFGNHASSEATIAEHRQWHNKGNALFHVGHGGRFELTLSTRDGNEMTIDRPGVLLSDGPLVDLQMEARGYDFRNVRVVFNNNCTLGRLEAEEFSRELEGHIASMTLLGCRRLVSASWELDDESSADFAGYYLRALLDHAFIKEPQKHAFAYSLSKAVSAFRRDHKRFDHPFFWAPYVQYGVP